MTSTVACGTNEGHLTDFQGYLVHKAIVPDLVRLQSAAQKAGFELAIASSFRSFERQLLIWNNKFTGVRPVLDQHEQIVDMTQLSERERVFSILLFSALPGASRHHWGTDLDIYDRNAVSDDYQVKLEQHEYDEGGPFYSFNQWLNEQLPQLGFFKPYHRYLGGVAAEPWHISHIKQSQKIETQLDINVLSQVLSHADIAGKATILQHLPDIYQQYIVNINAPTT